MKACSEAPGQELLLCEPHHPLSQLICLPREGAKQSVTSFCALTWRCKSSPAGLFPTNPFRVVIAKLKSDVARIRRSGCKKARCHSCSSRASSVLSKAFPRAVSRHLLCIHQRDWRRPLLGGQAFEVSRHGRASEIGEDHSQDDEDVEKGVVIEPLLSGGLKITQAPSFWQIRLH